MAFGFESGITDFFVRRESLFSENDLKGSFQDRILDLKNKMKSRSNVKPTIVILGAGPAGLLRAIQSISNGNPTTVIERRAEDASGRINTVALTKTTIAMLQYCGIYQYLLENGLIYPPNGGGYISVRLTDLEHAMKEILKLLSPNSVIDYDSKVTKVDYQSDKIKLHIQSAQGEQKTLSGVDILVIAEGSHSSTNSLLGTRRTEILPPIPVIAAINNDRRPTIVGINSLLRYAGKSIVYIAKTIYYHVQFLFKFILSKNFRKQFTGALILKTPKQHYLGCGFSDEINARLVSLKATVTEKREMLKKFPANPHCQRELQRVEKNYNAYAKHWINLALCYANFVSIMSRFYKGPHLYMGCHRSLDSFEVIQIGADRANEYCKIIKQSAILLAGDASATVDPTTGLGCNTAIQSSVDFLDFIWDYDAKIPQKQLVEDYDRRIQKRIFYIHAASKVARELFRPDALAPRSMFMMA